MKVYPIKSCTVIFQIEIKKKISFLYTVFTLALYNDQIFEFSRQKLCFILNGDVNIEHHLLSFHILINILYISSANLKNLC